MTTRRAFLTGLLASSAALAVAGPVVAVVPNDDEIFALLRRRMDDAYALMSRQMTENLYGDISQRAETTFVYLTDEEPVRYQHAEFGVKVTFER